MEEGDARALYDEAPTRVVLTRPIQWDDLDTPTIGAARVSLPLPEIPSRARRRISRSDWTLLIAAIAIVIALVGTAAVFGLAGLPSPSGNAAPAGVGVTAPATATPTATLAPTATATPLPAVEASYVSTDLTTQGSWQGQYGGQGYIVVGDTQQLPASIQVTPANQQEFTWAGSTTDPRALQMGSNPGDRVAACWYATGSFTIDVNITDGQTYQLALYVVDWDQLSRAEIINVLDATTDTVLDTRSVTSFTNGQYLVWNVRGHIAMQITNAPNSPNAVVSGLFLAPAAVPGQTPSATPVATDTPSTPPDATPTLGADATPTVPPSP